VVGEHTEHRGRGVGTVNATDGETEDSRFTSLCVTAAKLERLFEHPREEERVLVPCDQIG
jgi:sporulation protein YlmC with PRC-barrel domain